MTDLEQRMRERIASNAFMFYNHMELDFVEPDRAVFSLRICPESLNNHGTLHGGAAYALADMATGVAVNTDGRRYVTQNGSLQFLAAQTEGVVRADARVRHRGRSICGASVDILGDDNKLLATGDFAFFCVERKA